MTHADRHLLEVEDKLACMARQIEATGELYAKVYEQLVVVDTKLRQTGCMDKAAIAEQMHLQTRRLHNLSGLFPAMSGLVMQLRKKTLTALANASTPPGQPQEETEIQELLASLKTVDTLVKAMLSLVHNALCRASKTLSAVIAS